MRTDTSPLSISEASPQIENEMHELLARIRDGKNVRVAPLADAIGMSRGGLYGAIEAGDVEAVKLGRAVLVPAHVARRLLGLKPESLAA